MRELNGFQVAENIRGAELKGNYDAALAHPPGNAFDSAKYRRAVSA
jgi:hypothetical protein